MNDDQPKQKMTSVEAAALILSEGRTKDPALAEVYAEGNQLDMEDLRRAHLRRMMGFDFEIKIRPNKIHVFSREAPYVTTHAKLKEGDAVQTPNGPQLVSEAAIDRLVDACARLKEKWTATKEKESTK